MWIISSTREEINKKPLVVANNVGVHVEQLLSKKSRFWRHFDGRANLTLHFLSHCCYWMSLRVIHPDNSVVRTIRSSISFLVIAIIGEHSSWRRPEVDGREASHACWLAISCLQNWIFERLSLVLLKPASSIIDVLYYIYRFLSI